MKDQLIINNFNDKYIIFIDSQSNKKSYFCSFTTNMALNPFGIYCKFAINSESKAVLSFSVKCQSNKNRHQRFSVRVTILPPVGLPSCKFC